MIRFLQRQKAKKGFTIIELIVVIAIIAVLMAVILPNLTGEREKINAANSAARDFYAVLQTVMTKYSMYEGPLSPAYSSNSNLGIMRYYPLMGGNYPFDSSYDKGTTDTEYPENASMYVMVHAQNDIIRDIAVMSFAHNNNSTGNFQLCNFLERPSIAKNTEFGRLLSAEIDGRISFVDGWYYARVDFRYPLSYVGTPSDDIKKYTLKVAYTAYCRNELPQAPDSGHNDFINKNLTFGSDYKLNWNGEICGICGTINSGGVRLGTAGTYLN